MKTLISIFLTLSFLNQSFAQPVWNFQNSGTTSNLNRIYLRYGNSFTEQTLFIAGDNGVILRTTNSGLIWETMNSNTTSNLYDIVIGTDTGYAVGSGGTIIKTIDGGNNWSNVQSNTINNINEFKFISRSQAIAVGDNGTFLKLNNDVWIFTQIDTSDLNSISVNSNIMFIVGNYGTILRTSNGGITWNRLNSYTKNNLNNISAESTNKIIVGNAGTVLHISGGTITLINTGTLNDLKGLYTNYNISVCGANGTVLRNYQPVNTITNTNYNSIIQTGIDNCFVIGDNGEILFTNFFNVTPNSKQLNSSNISTWFFSNGLFNRYPNGSGGFEWPKGENKYARYSSGLFLGAIVNSDTLVTTCNYQSEYFPGQTINGVPQGNGTQDFRVYKLVYNVNDSDRIKWPNSLLGNSNQDAPLYFDSSSMNWMPSDFGNQTMFYSFTDSYDSSHTSFQGNTAPLKADVKQINFSFNQPEELRNIIYQEYRIINRGSSQWTNAYINFYTDDDLGSSTGDAEGVDTNLNLAYTYEFTNYDPVYGIAPPAVGFSVIRAPVIYTGNVNDTVFYYEGKRKKIKVGFKETRLNSTVIYHDDGLEPHNYRESYNAIRGLQNDGSPYINPTNGQATRFVYSGDPVTGTGWIQLGWSDMRFYQGFGPLNMNPGDTQVIVIAQVIARGSSNLNSITKLREVSQTAKYYYDNCFSDIVIGINNITTSAPENYYLHQNYPNPFNPNTIINYELGITNYVTLKVYDDLGKEVVTLVNEKQNAGKYSVKFNGSNLSSGIYFYKIEINDFIATKKMLLVK